MKKVIEIVNDLLTKWGETFPNTMLSLQYSYNKSRMACITFYAEGFKNAGQAFFEEDESEENLMEIKNGLEKKLNEFLNEK